MKLAFYKAPGTWADKAIRLFTGSAYSHVELVINGMCYSSSIQDSGVRCKGINIHSGNWDVVDIPGDERKALKWFADHDGQAYDWAGVFRFLLPLLPNSANRWFCSEAVAAALGIKDPEAYTPQDLYEGFR